MGKEELFKRVDKCLNDLISNEAAKVSRFYSDEDNVVVAYTRPNNSVLCDIEKEVIKESLSAFGYNLYDSGACDDKIMMTFKK